MSKSKTVHVHMEVPQDMNSRIKQLAVSEETRTGKRTLIRDKYLECLGHGVAFQEQLEK